MSLVGFRSQNHPQQCRHKGSRRHVDDRALPAEDFRLLDQRFSFTVDAAAAAHNAKLPRYWSELDSGLDHSWAGERVYCNPPFSDILPWVLKAWEETDSELVVMLLPANRTEQGWWQDHIEPYRDKRGPFKVEFLKGRQRFIAAGKSEVGPNERPPFGICLCIWEFS